MSWSHRHLLDVDALSAPEMDVVLDRADFYRRAAAGPSTELAGRRVALFFAEPSTRTRLSFEMAARNLGAETFVLDPPASSIAKGESLVDTVRNLAAIGFDMLVLRHPRGGAAAVAARAFDGHVVNAGDGARAHPTQALLDLLTLRQAWNARRLDGRKIAIVGDLRHSRVARSNASALTRAGAEVWACGPPAMLEGFEALAACLPAGRLRVTSDLAAALADADAVMALRIQRERMGRARLSLDDYRRNYRIDEERMSAGRPGALFLHPGPINVGVEVTRDVATGARSLVLQQVRNGVPVRMAVLSLLSSTA